MGTEIQTVKNQMTLKNRAQDGAECQSSGMTVSARCELHGINVKTYYYHLRQVRESLLTENCVILLSTKNISDNIEIFSVDERIKPAVFYLSERSRRQCCSLFDYQHRTGKRHWCQRISDEHLPHRRKAIAAEIRIKHPPENVALFRETILRGLILFAETRGYWGVTKSTRHSFCACDGFFVIGVVFQWKVLNRREGEKQGY